MKPIIIKNGRVIDPANGVDSIKDVYLRGGTVSAPFGEDGGARVIDAAGLWVVPGLIDMHTHLREPGFEQKETIATGTAAAARGGFATVCCMPNTEPVIDNEILVEYIKLLSERDGVVNVLPIGAVTKGQKGEQLANIGLMRKAGIVALSEDGKTVADAALLKTAMKYGAMFGLPMLSHCEEPTLGASPEGEEIIAARDIIIAKSAGARLHICHVSAAGTVEAVRAARNRGQDVTAEVTPHHFTLTENDAPEFDTNYKMNSPLRSSADAAAVIEGLRDGTITVIATDHAPHTADEKNVEYDKAPNGIVGLETALPLVLTELGGVLPIDKLIAAMTINPANILELKGKGSLSVGADGDVTIIDPAAAYVINAEQFASKGRNTPFGGRKVKGSAVFTIVGGKVVYEYNG